MKGLFPERQTLSYLNDLLTLQHQSTFFAFMNGVENMIEYYLDKENDEYFYKLLLIRDQLANKNTSQISLIKSNGFYVQQSNITPQTINVDATPSEEFH
jgi:hypothetical protein